MEEVIIFTVVSCFLLLGLIGSVLPIIPGPIMSYLGILVLYFFTDNIFSNNEIFIYSIITALVFSSDYILQFLGVKKLGGQKNALYGTFFGIFAGLFFAPLGLLLGPFLGAFLGALKDNKEQKQAMRIAIGALLGFICGTFLKLLYSVFVIYVILNKLLFLS